MLITLSPAKKLDMRSDERNVSSEPQFVEETNELVSVAKTLGTQDLQKLMNISENLAVLNKERFEKFGNLPQKQAALAFAGDTYQGLEANTLDEADLHWAQDHLRILSGLYGLLRPLDDIQPYRLEMGSKLPTVHGANLYQFWGSKIAEKLNQDAEKQGTSILVNCASNEYFKSVDQSVLQPQVITPQFLEDKNGVARVQSFHAKRARGAMARFLVENRITDAQDIPSFAGRGYAYDAERSTQMQPVFVQPVA